MVELQYAHSKPSNTIQKKEKQPFFTKAVTSEQISNKLKNRNSASFFTPSPIQAELASAGGPTSTAGGRTYTAGKLKIGKPDDKYEREADALADMVVQKMRTPDTPPIQRKCSTCADEETVQRKHAFESEKEIQPKFDHSPSLQLKCESCEQAGQDDIPKVQQKSSESTPSSTPNLESQLAGSRGGGSPLPKDTRSSMEQAMGADFTSVRVHTGSSAVQMSRELGAQAFTHGSDIYFNEGKYDTNSNAGQHLLAHELTHTVQQGRWNLSAKFENSNVQVQKEEQEEVKINNVESLKDNEGNVIGYMKQKGKNISIHLQNFPIKQYASIPMSKEEADLAQSQKIAGREQKPLKSLRMPKPGTRKTHQSTIWKRDAANPVKKALGRVVDDSIKDEPELSLTVRNQNPVIRKSGKTESNRTKLLGSFDALAKEIVVPFWDMGGRPRIHEIEHKVDWQILGDRADVIANLILIDKKSNAKLGNEIRRQITSRIKGILKHYKKAGVKNLVGYKAARWKYKIFFDSFKYDKAKIEPKSILSLSNIEGAGNNPINKENLEVQKAEIPKGHLLLKTSEAGAGYLIKYNFKNRFITIKGNAKEHKLTSVTYKKILRDKKGNFEGIEPIELQFERVKQDVYKLNNYHYAGVLKNILKLKYLSLIKLTDDIKFDPYNGMSTSGLVDTDIEFLKKAKINFDVINSTYEVNAQISSSQIKDLFPKPFIVDNAYLGINLSTNSQLDVEGGVDFSIQNIGTGSLSAKAHKKGFSLKGSFDFDSDKFDKARLEIGYDSAKDNEGVFPWSIGGELKIGKDKLTGVQSLIAKVVYDENGLNGDGIVRLNIPGFEGSHTIKVIYHEDGGFSIKTELTLPDKIPGLKGGDKIKLGISRKAGENDFSLTIGGEAEIALPGLENGLKIKVLYDKGVILLQGEIPFSFIIANKEASGKIKVGITNQVVADNKPTGQIAKEWILFGEGEVSMELAEGIGGKAKVILLPDGDIVASGELVLDPSKAEELSKETRFDKFIFRKDFPPIILFTIPAVGASLQLKIRTSLKREGYFKAPYFKALSIAIKNFNLTNPKDDFKLDGFVIVAMSGGGGIFASLNLQATMTIGFVGKISGGLDGSVGVEAGLGAEACLNLTWSNVDGLQIEDGRLTLKGFAQFLAKLKGKIRVYLDLWLAEIDIWEEKLEIASVYFGVKQQLSLEMPVSMRSGKLEGGQFAEDNLSFPDITSTEKQQSLAKEAVEQDSKVAPPPPPSKEEATKVVRGLPSGRINTGIKSLDADQIKLIYPAKMVKRNWAEDVISRHLKEANYATRDSYLYWLNHRYTEMDWSEPRAVGIKRDRAELEQLKYLIRNNDVSEKKARSMVKKFKRDHSYFTNEYVSEIDQLLNRDFQSRLPEAETDSDGQLMSLPPPDDPDPYMSYSSEEEYSQYMSYPDEGDISMNPDLEEPEVGQKPCDKVQLKEDGYSNTEKIPTGLETKLIAEKENGSVLPESTKGHMEEVIGADFSNVRVHNDAAAEEMNKQLGAQAFTHGSDIYFNEGKYDTGSSKGQHLLAHELTHTVQQRNQGKALQRNETDKEGDKPMPTSDGDLLNDWKRDPKLFLSVLVGNKLIVVPGAYYVYSPDTKALERYRAAKAHTAGDLGTFFGIPATGASGTRLIRSGKRNAVVIDAGRGKGVTAAVYLSQVQGLMALMGISGDLKIKNIHVHKDHTSEIPSLVRSLNLKPADIVIPGLLIRGGQRYYQKIVQEIRALGGDWTNWAPGTKMRNKGGQGDVIRNRFVTGDIEIESIALRSALKDVAKNADLASYLTKVTRRKDQAKILILGDLRMKDLEKFAQSMGSQQWRNFAGGVTKISGFSHHAGRMDAKDTRGLMKLLDATLLKTGKLEVIVQTDLSRHREARSETVEFMRRIGVNVKMAETSGSGTSGVVSGKNSTSTTGSGARSLQPIDSPLTAGLSRMNRLLRAKDTITTWRGIFEARGAKAKDINQLLSNIDTSVRTLREALRTSVSSAAEVRTATKRTDRNYSGGERGLAFQTSLSRIPQTTVAETSIKHAGFKTLENLRNTPTDKLPMRVAMERALFKGEYSPKAFQYMLSQIDPKTRDSHLTGKRGGRSPKMKAFERVRATYMLRSSVLPSGQFLSVSGMSRGKARVARGTAGILAIAEIAGIASDLKQSYDIGQEIKKRKDVIPFVKRIMFWNQLGVQPEIRGVEDNWIYSNYYESDYEKVIQGINKNRWDAVYIKDVSDVDIIRFGITLTHLVRNFDEFSTLFLDSDQDAIKWENHSEGWEKATWKIKLGKFDTDWENEVEESWIEKPQFTKLMQMYVKRIIANTEKILELEKEGKAPAASDTESELGGLISRGNPIKRAKLKADIPFTPVKVIPDLNDCYWNGRSTRSKSLKLDKTIKWWSPPEFYVFSTDDEYATVGGADYNTYAILRMLETYMTQCEATQQSLNHTAIYRTSNSTGLVKISKSLLKFLPL